MSKLKLMSNVLAFALLGVLFFPGAAVADTYKVSIRCLNPTDDVFAECDVNLFDEDFVQFGSIDVRCFKGDAVDASTASTSFEATAFDMFLDVEDQLFDDQTDCDGFSFVDDGRNDRYEQECFLRNSKTIGARCKVIRVSP